MDNLAPIVETETLSEIESPDIKIEDAPRRGRPPGSKNKVTESIHSPSPADDTGAKKRGRPAGSGKKAIDKSALAKQLLFAHAVAAQMTKIPDLALDSGEAQILADAVTNLMEEYDIALSGKTAALLGMLGAAAIVYGPRVVIITDKVKRAKSEAKQKAELQLVQSANG